METGKAAEIRVHGNCRCGRKVVKVLNSKVHTFRRDGTRYAYPERVDKDGWSIFRCEVCHEPIADTFSAATPEYIA